MGAGSVTPAAFRRKLVHELAYRTPWAKQQALRGKSMKLAQELGVAESVLLEAVDLVRMGFRPKVANRRSALVSVRTVVPVEVSQLMDNLALATDRTRQSFVRDLVHAAMQTPREPETVVWNYTKKSVFRGKLLSGKVTYYLLTLSGGLRDAVERRAAARGMSRYAYIRCWIVDLVEGRLGDLEIPRILSSQMFDAAEAYSLPIGGG